MHTVIVRNLVLRARRVAAMLVAALTIILMLPSSARAQYTTCPEANPNDEIADDGPLNTCLIQGGTVDLFSGSPGYIIATGLTLSVNGTHLTNTHGGYAGLIADQALAHTMLRVEESVSGYELSNLGFDGRVRDAQGNVFRSNQASCDGYRGELSNVVIRGSNFSVHDNYSIQALCGSAMEIVGVNFEIAYNVLANNGTAQDEPYAGTEPWSDGITLLGCNSGYVHGNFLWDNTDIDLVVGGGPNCRIESNRIDHYFHYGFAGIHVGWFLNYNGDHSGSLYSGHDVVSNTVDKLAFGIVVGYHPWDPRKPISAPNVSGNFASGAVVNLAVDGADSGSVQSNGWSGAQGVYGFGCRIPADYTAAHFGSASVQGGWRARWYHDGYCGNRLFNEALYSDATVTSADHRFHLIYQSDGNLVLYRQDGTPTWASGTWGTSVGATWMQDDGNLVVYDATGYPVWNSGTWGNPGAYLEMQSDGNLVIYSAGGAPLWSTGTPEP